MLKNRDNLFLIGAVLDVADVRKALNQENKTAS